MFDCFFEPEMTLGAAKEIWYSTKMRCSNSALLSDFT